MIGERTWACWDGCDTGRWGLGIEGRIRKALQGPRLFQVWIRGQPALSTLDLRVESGRRGRRRGLQQARWRLEPNSRRSRRRPVSVVPARSTRRQLPPVPRHRFRKEMHRSRPPRLLRPARWLRWPDFRRMRRPGRHPAPVATARSMQWERELRLAGSPPHPPTPLAMGWEDSPLQQPRTLP